jgi:hypothetical protein
MFNKNQGPFFFILHFLCLRLSSPRLSAAMFYFIVLAPAQVSNSFATSSA